MKTETKTYFICVVLFALLLVSFCKPVQAEFCKRKSFVVNLSSIHYSDPLPETGRKKHNKNNYGLGAECLHIIGGEYGQPITLSAGFYDNSYDELSLYLNTGLVINDINNSVNLSFEAGIVSGYEDLIATGKVPKLTDNIIYYAGFGIRAKLNFRNAVKTLIVPDFVGFQYQRDF